MLWESDSAISSHLNSFDVSSEADSEALGIRCLLSNWLGTAEAVCNDKNSTPSPQASRQATPQRFDGCPGADESLSCII